MDKFWVIYSKVDQLPEAKTPQEALNLIQQLKLTNKREYYIMESIAFTGQPAQQIDLTKEEYSEVI